MKIEIKVELDAIAQDEFDVAREERDASDRKWCDWANRQLELNYENMRNWLDDKLAF
jgi:hypothetical protein|tara:strand:+ start:556 stop:726 length:171 start_codon:yes stop_codon:yes gene_type:complete